VTIAYAGIATYTRRLDVLPGSFNDNGAVNSGDVLGVDREIGVTYDLCRRIDRLCRRTPAARYLRGWGRQVL
jgi:hypothetical protein